MYIVLIELSSVTHRFLNKVFSTRAVNMILDGSKYISF